MSVIAEGGVDTYNDRDMRTVLEPLGKLADNTDCMIVGLSQFNKSAGDDPLNLVTGSRAFTAVVRSVIAVVRDPDAEDGQCIVSQVKNNLGRLDLPNLTYVVRSATVQTREGGCRNRQTLLHWRIRAQRARHTCRGRQRRRAHRARRMHELAAGETI
jgi:hypothetical protein